MLKSKKVNLIVLMFVALLALAVSQIVAGKKPGGETLTPLESLGTEIMGVADGWIVVKTWLNSAEPNGKLGGASATKTEVTSGLQWTVVSGATDRVRDPFTGETLFRPKGLETVVVVPRLGGVSGEPLTLGIDLETLAAEEREFLQRGGGACIKGIHYKARASETVDVRSVIDAQVIPISLTERLLVYKPENAMYYAYSEEAGPMRLTFNPSFSSFTRLKTNNPNLSLGDDFFPATSDTQLYFNIDYLNLGVRIFNSGAMKLSNERIEWPPFNTPQTNKEHTIFHDAANDDVVLMEIVSQEQYVYPTEELAIQVVDLKIDDFGHMTGIFSVENLTENQADVRWFVIGAAGEPLNPSEGLVTLAGGASTQFEYEGTVSKALYNQRLVIGAVSQGGTRLSGLQSANYYFPSNFPERERMLR